MLRYWEDVHYQYRLGLYDEVEYERQKAAWKATFANSVGFAHYWSEVRTLDHLALHRRSTDCNRLSLSSSRLRPTHEEA